MGVNMAVKFALMSFAFMALASRVYTALMAALSASPWRARGAAKTGAAQARAVAASKVASGERFMGESSWGDYAAEEFGMKASIPPSTGPWED